MKKKLILMMSMIILVVCALALSVSAAKIYKTEGGETLFSYEVSSNNVVASYEGAFPKVDSEGNALIWYLISSETVGEDTVCTVGSFKTIGAEGNVKGTVNESGEYSISGVNGNKIVSLNLPDNSGIKLINIDFGAGYTKTFPKDSQILFAYFPNTLEEYTGNTGGGGWKIQRLFQFTPIIECYFSDLDTTNENHMKGIGNFDFYGCYNLKKIVLPNGLESIFGDTDHNKGPAFYGCLSLKEIVIPNTVTSIGARVFEQCAALEVVRLGANTNITNGFQLFIGNANLKRIYLAGNEITVGNNMFYNYSKNTVIFFTGTEAEYLALKTNLSATSNHSNFTNAKAVEYDSANGDQYYADLAVSEGKWLVVYGYNTCEAFYEGKHTVSDENNINDSDYFKSILVTNDCSVCGKTSQIVEEIAPIFVWKGYSASTFGDGYSVVQGFTVNTSSIEAYKAYAPDFDFGILATVNKEVDEEGNAVGIKPSLDSENVLTGNFDKDKHEYLDIKVTGIKVGYENAKIVFCVYVTVNGTMYYLDNNTTSESVVGISYNEALELNKSEVTE